MLFRLSRSLFGAVPLVSLVLLLAVACGPSATATPTPGPTATPRPTNTPVQQQATATPVPQQATATPTSRPATTVTTGPQPTATPTTAQPTATPTKAVVATPTPAPTNTPTPGAQPKKGGVLVTWIRREPGNYDSVQMSTIDFTASHSSMYSKLLELDKETTSKVVPDLAETWDVADGGKTFTFHLRKNVKWHDGQPFTAQDVLDYFNRVMNPPAGIISIRQANMANITSVTAPDPYTVVFKSKEPDPEFLIVVAADAGNQIQPKRLYEKYGDNPTADQVIGTGPFKMKSWERNNAIEVVRNQDYYLAGKPYLDGIRWAFGRDQATMFAAFRTGRIDISSRGGGMDLTPEQMKIVDGMAGARVQNFMVGSPYNFTGNASRAPWNDKRLRQAVDLGLDRQFICDSGLGGLCTWGFILPPWSPYTYSGEEVLKWPGFRQPKDQDLAKAKALLKETGLALPIPVKLLVRDSITRIAEPFAFSMEQIGFKVTIQIVDTVQYQKEVQGGDYQAAVGPVGTWGPSLNEFIPEYLGLPNTESQSKHTDPKLDQMWLAQATMLDPQQRRTAVREMLDYMKDQAYHAVLFGLTRPVGVWDYVKNFKAPNGPQHYNLKYDDVWLER